jgi:23S rRNA (guanosine2251-2'-O)-methyltransferase
VNRPRDTHQNADLVFGLHAVEGLLSGGPAGVREVLVDASAGREARALGEQAGRLGIPSRVLPAVAFRSVSGNRSCQGIAARIVPFRYAEVEALIRAALAEPPGLIVALDQVQDPQNLGSILRSAAFFGVRGVVIPKDRAAGVTPAVVRTSAGGAGRVPVAQVTNLARTLRQMRDEGLRILGAATRGGEDPATVRLEGAAVLVMGSEGEGLRRLVREACDTLLTLPSPGGFESLNVGVATGILVHALLAPGGKA